jgi:hypothetical protein
MAACICRKYCGNGTISSSESGRTQPTVAGEAVQQPARCCREEHQLDLRHILVHLNQPPWVIIYGSHPSDDH